MGTMNQLKRKGPEDLPNLRTKTSYNLGSLKDPAICKP